MTTKRFILCLLLVLPLLSVAYGANKGKAEKSVKFMFYGKQLQARFDAAKRVRVKKCDSLEVARCRDWLNTATEKTLKDCLDLKEELNLCDWGYLRMLDKLSQASLGNTNEATLLMAWLYNRSGFNAIIALENGRQVKKPLRLLYGADGIVFEKAYFTLNGHNYFVYGKDADKVRMTSWLSPIEGRDLSFSIKGEQKLAYAPSETRTVTATRYPDFSFSYNVNKNLIDFYNDYPATMPDSDFISRWALIANTQLDRRLDDTLLKEMGQKLKGLSQQEAVERLLNWVQTGLAYEYDDKIWGGDRAFFAEETLFYPYCDTEDRAILLCQLVRNLLGLKTMIIYYPGHLATGVCFTDADVKGSYVVKDGWHFVVCDPTYVNAKVGVEMPGMEEKEKKVIILQDN